MGRTRHDLCAHAPRDASDLVAAAGLTALPFADVLGFPQGGCAPSAS
jgi:hypothetical protein